ncbi:MAG: rod shape-determining protein RodA [Clostridia bacterium]
MFDFDKKLLKNLDWSLIVIYVLLSIIGLFAVAATTASDGVYFTSAVKRQLMWVLLSYGVVAILLFLDYRVFNETAYALLAVSILLLVFVLFFGPEIKGSKRWIFIGSFSLQPSEFAKIFFVLGFAKYLVSKRNNINSIFNVLSAVTLGALPIVLIYLQPDLGTSLVLVFMLIVLLFVAGIAWKYIIATGVASLVAAPIVWTLLKDYQRNRILTFFNPESDPLGAAYNVIQSRIAIGSGNWGFLSESSTYVFNLTGKGIFSDDSMTSLKFIPEQYTDFIFSAIGEGFGFLGAALVIILITLLIYRSIKIAIKAKDLYGAYVVIGLASMFLFHSLVNIGMTMGLMPVTGLPLPFISLGGSSFLANSIALGIILNIGMRHKKIQF